MTIVINGTTGISGVDGSAATPAVQGADTNTGVFYPAADTVGVSTGGTERMRVDSSGNVGIGTTTITDKLTVAGNTRLVSGTLVVSGPVQAGNQYYGWEMYNVDSSTNYVQGYNRSTSAWMNNVYTALSHQWHTSGSEKMRLDSSGNVGIGTSSPTQKLELNSGFVKVGNGVGGGGGVWFPYSSDASGRTWRARSDIVGYGDFGFEQSTTQTGTTFATQALITQAGLFQFNSGYGSVATAYGCRAWVNFNGTGTVAIRASGNVTSITDNGTGDYTVNFTTAMSDANYSTTVTCASDSDGFLVVGSVNSRSGASTNPTTTAQRIFTRTSGTNTDKDPTYVNIAVIR